MEYRIDFSEYKAYCDELWKEGDNLPDDVLESVFTKLPRAERKHRLTYDLVTPFTQGKIWLYELMVEHLPETASILLSGGPLYIRRHWIRENAFNLDLCHDVQGKTIEIFRCFAGCNFSDENYNQSKLYKDKPYGERSRSLPKSILNSFYYRMDGMSIPNNQSMGIRERLLPKNTWHGLDYVIEENKLPDAIFDTVVKLLPEVDTLDGCDERWVALSAFLVAQGYFSSNNPQEGDWLFVKETIQDGVIYHVKDLEFEKMRILSSPEQAIDSYCAHVLMGRNERFDFLPYTSEN